MHEYYYQRLLLTYYAPCHKSVKENSYCSVNSRITMFTFFICLFRVLVYRLFVCPFVCLFCLFVCLFVLFYPVSWLEDSRSAIVVELLLRERFSVSRNINFLKKKFLRTVNVKVRLRWLKAILFCSFVPWLESQINEVGAYLVRSSRIEKERSWTILSCCWSSF